MGANHNVQTVKAFFAAVGEGDRPAAVALLAEDGKRTAIREYVDTQALARASQI